MKRNRLKEAIMKLKRLVSSKKQRDYSLHPESAFDAMLDLRLKELQRQLGEVKGRINGLIFFVLGAAIAQVALGFVS